MQISSETPLVSLLLSALGTGMATTVGALPFLWARVSRRLYDTMLGFGAGLMLAAATLGLLTTALEEVRAAGQLDLGRLALVLCGFTAGVMLLWLMDRSIPHVHAGGHHGHVHGPHGHAHEHEHDDPGTARKQGFLAVGAMSLHRFPEGFAIGAAYASHGPGLGATLAVAIALQNAVEGAVMAAPLQRSGLRPWALVGLIAITGLTIPIAAVAGYYIGLSAAGALPLMLALAAGGLLYLACNEIIPESHSHGNEVRATFGLLAGFVFLIIMQVALGHTH
ncbi:MAG TPA: ZIP family metal transporter [Polyangia bacterium]|nr:ZIP family metal transporter [Polyangia bacterium]